MKETDISGIEIILFGSFISSEKYNDIDLIIVYDGVPFNLVKDLKELIDRDLQKEFNAPVHFTTLSRTEFDEDHRLQDLESVTIYK